MTEREFEILLLSLRTWIDLEGTRRNDVAVRLLVGVYADVERKYEAQHRAPVRRIA